MATALGKSIKTFFTGESFSKPAPFNANDEFESKNFRTNQAESKPLDLTHPPSY